MLVRNLYLLCSYVRRGNTMRFARILLPVVASVLLLSPAWGQSTQDRVSVRDDIVIERGETVADAVCIGCSIRIEGAVMGDAVSIGGRITVPGRVGGDVVAVGGSIDLTGVVDGDVVAVAGFVELGPGAAVGGDAVGVLGGVEGVRDGRVAGKVTSVRSIVPIVASGFVVLLAICLVAALIIQPLLTLLCAIVLGPQRLEVLARTAASRGLMSFIVGVGLLFASFLLGVFRRLHPVLGTGDSAPNWADLVRAIGRRVRGYQLLGGAWDAAARQPGTGGVPRRSSGDDPPDDPSPRLDRGLHLLDHRPGYSCY